MRAWPLLVLATGCVVNVDGWSVSERAGRTRGIVTVSTSDDFVRGTSRDVYTLATADGEVELQFPFGNRPTGIHSGMELDVIGTPRGHAIEVASGDNAIEQVPGRIEQALI